MNKPKLILIGAGGHSRSCIDLIEQEGTYQIAGLVGFPKEVGTDQFGYEVIGSDKDLYELAKHYENALITVGQIQTSENRMDLFNKAKTAGFLMKTIISKQAYVSPHAKIGVGTVVMNGAVINAGSKVGDNCIVNSKALIEHDVEIENHCHVSTGSIINGNSFVGSGSFIGSGVIVKHGISIGANSIIGMGLVIRQDIGEGVKFLGIQKP
jgi:sugar O-acyltransferase (sialic acid O-acetyltransferase NeuD family)